MTNNHGHEAVTLNLLPCSMKFIINNQGTLLFRRSNLPRLIVISFCIQSRRCNHAGTASDAIKFSRCSQVVEDVHD